MSTSFKLLPHLKVPSTSVSRPTSPLIPCLIKPISHLSASYVCPVWARLRTKLYLLVYNPINLNRDKYVFPLPCHLHFSLSLEEIRKNCSSPSLITLILEWSVLCFTLLPGLDYKPPSWSEQGRVGKEIFPKAPSSCVTRVKKSLLVFPVVAEVGPSSLEYQEEEKWKKSWLQANTQSE